MTQLVELQEALPKFEAAGIALYAVSYDEVDALEEFARHHGITFPLLSDRGSKVIRKLGIQNHFVTREHVPYYGIPFPGTFLLDESGVVSARFFNRHIAQRESAEHVIDTALGEILLGAEEPAAHGGSEEIRITAAYHGGGGTMKAAVMRQIVVRFELAPGLHIYDEPVPEGMVATRIGISGPPGLQVSECRKPPTKPLRLPGVEGELRVWEGRVDFVIPVSADDRIAGITQKIDDDEIEVAVRVDYQACDSNACHVPQNETLSVTVPLAPYLGHALGAELPGAVISSMDSWRFMQRMVRRGLLRSPIRGLRYLRKTMEDLRRGPAGRRRHRPEA